MEQMGLTFTEFQELFGLFNQAIREVGAANKILVIDLAREVPSEPEYVYDPVHLTERASKLAAKVISRELAPLVEERLQVKR